MTEDWERSASAWIAHQGENGDFSREFVLDGPMLARVRAGAYARALDVGCGEGRFCRMLRAEGLSVEGIDPTPGLLERARALDPEGAYRAGSAEALPFEDGRFDLVVSYLSLIDIPDIDAAIPEMARVLKPGGALLIANMNSFWTAADADGWKKTFLGRAYKPVDRYLEDHVDWTEWSGIRIQNHHRPLSRYMQLLLGQGLALSYFDEPAPTGGPPQRAARYVRAPWHFIMEWRRPVS